MAGSRSVDENSTELDHNTDRYPTFSSAVQRILKEGNLPDGGIERLEVTCLASGEVAYRWWTPRADEPEGGYLEPA